MTASSTLWNLTKYGIFLFALKCTNFAACVLDAPHFLKVKRARSWYMIVYILFLSSSTSCGHSHICDFAIELQETLSEAISHKETAVSASNELA